MLIETLWVIPQIASRQLQGHQKDQACDYRVWTFNSLKWLFVCSVLPDSLQSYGLQPTRLLCPQDFSGKNTGVGCHFLLQGTFLTQVLNLSLLCLLHQQADSLPLSNLMFNFTTLMQRLLPGSSMTHMLPNQSIFSQESTFSLDLPGALDTPDHPLS